MNRNRLKLWLYMLLFAVAGAANLFGLTSDLAARALREADQGLQVGAAHLQFAERLMASEAAAITGLAVKNAELLETLFAAPPRTDAAARKKGKTAAPREEAAESEARWAANEAAARTAVEEAASRLAIMLPANAFWAVANPEWVSRKLPEELQDPQRKEAAAFLRDVATGTPRRGYVRVNDGLWYGVGYPAGEGAALALFIPLDLAWARSMAVAAGVQVTLDVGTPQLVTTAQPDLARRLLKSTTATSKVPVSEGTAPSVLLEQPFKMRVPVLFVKAPAARAMALPLSGMPKAFLVLSVPTVGYFSDLARYQWGLLIILGALLLVGLLLGVLVKTEVLPQVPASLVAAATKIERGDFSARAPEFLGALGTVAGALNKAATVAEGSAVRLATGDPFATDPGAPRFNLPSEPSFTFPPTPASVPSPGAPPAELPAADPAPAPVEAREGASRLTGGAGFSGAAFEAVPQPRPASPAPTAPAPPRPTSTAIFQAVTPPAPAEESDEEHWRSVHSEFLRIREQCGEPVDGLGYDRFRPKLEKNKQQLVEKHGCRTVRFSVYVKDGKAALRATPVK
jgi:hypothetical protein